MMSAMRIGIMTLMEMEVELEAEMEGCMSKYTWKGIQLAES